MSSPTAGTVPPYLSLRDREINKTLAKSCHLSMEISQNRLAAALLHIHTNQYIAYEAYDLAVQEGEESLQTEIESIYSNSDLFANAFRSTSITWCFHSFTLIPEHLFEPKHISLFANNAFVVEEDTILCFDRIPSTEIINIYPVPASLLSMLQGRYPTVKSLHDLTVFIASTALGNKTRNKKRIYLKLKKKAFDILVFDEDRLLFCNTFKYLSDEDVLYFLLYSCEQLGIETDNIELVVFGMDTHRTALMATLRKYVHTVRSAERPMHADYPEGFDHVGDETTLFSQYRFV